MQRSRSAALNPQRGTGPRSAGIVLLVCFKSLNFQKAGSGKDTRTHWACLECLLEHFSLTAPSLPQHIPSRRTAAIRIPSVRPRRSEQRITGVVGSENYLLSHGCGVGCTVFLRSGKKKSTKTSHKLSALDRSGAVHSSLCSRPRTKNTCSAACRPREKEHLLAQQS